MRRGTRVAVVGMTALVCALVGSIGAAVLHWVVVQPSDDELRSAARGVSLSGFTTRDPLEISGAWAPSFDRGVVHWDAATDRVVTVDDLAVELQTEGWVVDATADPDGTGTLHGVRRPFYLELTLLPGETGGSTASVVVGRGVAVPSMTTAVWLGVAAGGAIGGFAGLALVRRHDRRHPRPPWIPPAVRYRVPSAP